mmetsp:Transcript_60560/g.131249  ORF Transcript_60560/g.131249 Transcript_60560/m.131249 type:complete len:244 (-) Transcript_60560:102-833(-)
MALFQKDGVTLTEKGGVLHLVLDRGECRINPTSVSLLSEGLAVAEKHPHPKSLVVAGQGKFFCNGLDVEWLDKNPKGVPELLESFWRVLARLLVMDCRTVCALNGHAFGAGVFLALACDYRIMRTKQGFVNFPELNLGMPLSKGFAELAKAKLSPSALRVGVLAGKRFGSTEAVTIGIVDAEFPVETLEEEAQKLAAEGLPQNLKLFRFTPSSYRKMKIELYTDAYRALTAPGGGSAGPESRL